MYTIDNNRHLEGFLKGYLGGERPTPSFNLYIQGNWKRTLVQRMVDTTYQEDGSKKRVEGTLGGDIELME